MTLFVFDMLFMAYLLILIGGLSTTFCLWYLATKGFSLSDKRRLDYLELGLKEEERYRKREDQERKNLSIENYTLIIEIQKELSKLQKKNDEKD